MRECPYVFSDGDCAQINRSFIECSNRTLNLTATLRMPNFRNHAGIQKHVHRLTTHRLGAACQVNTAQNGAIHQHGFKARFCVVVFRIHGNFNIYGMTLGSPEAIDTLPMPPTRLPERSNLRIRKAY